MILVLDTAAENVFIGLWDKEKSAWSSKDEFLGGRELNSLIIKKLDKSFWYSQENQNKLVGIIIAAGPGSFTGLRIGMSIANTLAYVRDIPIVAVPEIKSAEELLNKGLELLRKSEPVFEKAVTPHYGAEPHITKSKN